MERALPPDAKLAALRQSRAVHPHPEAVTAPAFRTVGFFDARDLVQVKYEMVRCVQREGQTVSAAAKAFGLSRLTFYQAQRALAQAGLPGLLPRRRGPHGPHKLTGEVREFLAQARAAEPTLAAAALVPRVREHFGIALHPRSIQRGLAKSRKGGAFRGLRLRCRPVRTRGSLAPTRRCAPTPSARGRPLSHLAG